MQRIEASSGLNEHAALADDIHRLIRVVDAWVTQQPILAEAVLFGERIHSRYIPSASLHIAVRYDQRRMMEGFDSWIEQLRTNFIDLSMALGECATVITPEEPTLWRRAYLGTDVAGLSTAMVRVMLDTSARPGERGRIQPASSSH